MAVKGIKINVYVSLADLIWKLGFILMYSWWVEPEKCNMDELKREGETFILHEPGITKSLIGRVFAIAF